MANEETLQAGAAVLAPWTIGTKSPETNRLDVHINAADMLACVKALVHAHWGYLIAITALDTLGMTAPLAQDPRWKVLLDAEGGATQATSAPLELLYFFANGPVVVTLRMLISRETPAILSVCGIISSASWYERELSEMFGIVVTDTPDPNHLFLPDGWKDGVYPLRKDFKQEQISAN
jgi:Ni,Fe-hydrogenase III component G